MTSIINNFEITSGLTITDGNLQVKTNSTNTSFDVSGNITIGSDDTVEGNTKLILKNSKDSTIELYSEQKKNAIINKEGILQFTNNKTSGCLYEFELGEGNTSVGFIKKNNNNDLAGIVFGKKSSLNSNGVDQYENSHISYNTLNNSQSLNLTGEKLIFNTSTGNYDTLAQAMIITEDKIGMFGPSGATPKVSLDVVGTDAIRIPSGTTGQRPANADASGCIRYNTTTSSYEGFGAGSQWGSLGGVKDVDQDTYISAETTAGTDNDQLKFYTEGTERMIIDTNGRVGIGISSPNQALHVIGSIQATSNITTTTFFGNVIADTINGTITTAAQSNITSVGTLTSLTLSGNVGIGTSSTSVPLEVHRTGSGDIAKFSRTGSMDLVINGDNGNCNFLVKSTTGINIAVDSSIPQYNSTKGIFIKSNGDVGIGTISPIRKFEVHEDNAKVGYYNNGTNGDSGFEFKKTYGGNDYTAYLVRNTSSFDITAHNNGKKIRLNNNSSGDVTLCEGGGNVGIGTNSPTYILEVISEAQVSDPNFTPTYWYGSLYCGHTNGGITLGRIGPTHTNCIQSRYGGAGSSLAINPFGGNVGIGTTSPGFKLDVVKDGYQAYKQALRVRGGTNTYGEVAVFESEITGASYSQQPFRFTQTASSSYWHAGSYENRCGIVTISSNSTAAKTSSTYYTSGVILMVGNNLGPDGAGDVRFSVKQDGEVHFVLPAYTTSDDRVKHNEKKIEDARSTINKLVALKYFKTPDVMYDNDHHFTLDGSGNPVDTTGNVVDYNIEIGFIAQEVEKIQELKHCVVVPEDEEIMESVMDDNGIEHMVKTGEIKKSCTPYSLNYQDIFVLNVQATQEIDRIQQQEKTKLEEQTSKLLAAEVKIEASEAKIAASEAKLATAETEIATLKNNDTVLLNKIATLESNFYNLQQQVQTLINNP